MDHGLAPGGDRPDKRDDWSNYVFVHKAAGCATKFDKVNVTEDTFRIKMVGGDDGAQWDGEAWLACHDFVETDKRDDWSAWLFAHRDENAGSIFKMHSGFEGYFKLEIVGCNDDAKWNEGHGWVCCHKFEGCRDTRDDWSNYLMVHKNEDTASVFHIN